MEKIDRRQFLKNIGWLGGGVLLATSPWFSVFSEQKNTTGSVARIGVIGPGSRGQFLMSFLAKNPKAEIVAIADIYQPSIDAALKIAPKAKVYHDYRQLLENKQIDAVVISTPLDKHYQMAMDAFDAGKHVFCEKSIAYSLDETYDIYQKYLSSGKVFFVGQQRLFDPRYIHAMEMVHSGQFGDISGIRTFWHRNNDWRRPTPSPALDEQINWRLYKAHSKGIMTELACHQLQIGTWALRQIPDKVMGHGSITYWKKKREVYDNVSCIYIYDNGVKMNFDSVLSNKFYGLEEQILCSKGTVEPEKSKYYFEEIPPAPAFLQLVNDVENAMFGSLPFAGTSWVPETANTNTGNYLLDKKPDSDGTSLMLAAFAEAVITQKQPALITEEGYYATALSLLGHQAMEEERILTFPDKYKLNYLNHKKV
ncbi:MAG TPA: Gfo/Idh/MocA family oxidoreductase [Paludibacter sp.]|nr:Gfo/Idh/MocA family oxidoreductase [Paludibacter sp.]